MPQLGKLLTEMLVNSGYNIEADNDALGSLLALDTDVPDDIATSLKSNLLTLESAKNNPDIKKHFTAQALNTIDTGLYEYADEYGKLSDDQIAEIKAEKSSYKKMRMMLDALRNAQQSAPAGVDDETKSKLATRKEEIEKLQREISEIKAQHEQSLSQVRSEAQNSILNYAIDMELSGKDYAQSELDKSTNILIARQIIDKQLNEMGAKVVSDGNNSLRLVRSDDPDMEFMRENKKLTFGSLADQILAEKKLLKTSAPASGNKPNTIIPKSAPAMVNESVTDLYDRQIAAMTGAATVE
jgi:hypothetical protein